MHPSTGVGELEAIEITIELFSLLKPGYGTARDVFRRKLIARPFFYLIYLRFLISLPEPDDALLERGGGTNHPHRPPSLLSKPTG